MGEVLLGILVLVLGGGMFLGIIHWATASSDIEERDRRILYLEYQLAEMTNKYNILMKQYSKEATQKVIYKTVNNSSDVKEAIRYAMVKAHPDNGGKEEDFIKFRKLYEGMK